MSMISKIKKFKIWYFIACRKLDWKDRGESVFNYIYIESYNKSLNIKYIFFIFWYKILMCLFSFFLFIILYYIFIYYIYFFNLIKFFYIQYFIYYRILFFIILFFYLLWFIFFLVYCYCNNLQGKNSIIIEMNLNKNYNRDEIKKISNQLNEQNIKLDSYLNLIRNFIKKFFIILLNIIFNIWIFCYIFDIELVNFMICNIILILYNILIFGVIIYYYLNDEWVKASKMQNSICTLFFHYPYILILLAVLCASNKIGRSSMKLLVYAFSDFVLIQVLNMDEFYSNDEEDIKCRWCIETMEEFENEYNEK